MLVGIKPTVGRISRYGVIPITADQDTPGPMARRVADAAILLGVLEGGAPDPADPDHAHADGGKDDEHRIFGTHRAHFFERLGRDY